MGSPVEEFVQYLQEQILEETKDAYGEIAFQRWSDPVYWGPLDDPDGYACIRGICGDTMQVFLKFAGGSVEEASFQTDGCGSGTACGSFAAELALGKTPEELTEITGEAIIDKLQGLPKDDENIAFLAAEALQAAAQDFLTKQKKNPVDHES